MSNETQSTVRSIVREVLEYAQGSDVAYAFLKLLSKENLETPLDALTARTALELISQYRETGELKSLEFVYRIVAPEIPQPEILVPETDAQSAINMRVI